MTQFIWGLIIGVFVGVIIGVFVLAILGNNRMKE